MFKFSNKIYDALKWIALYLLPALGTLYFALSGIWDKCRRDLPIQEERKDKHQRWRTSAYRSGYRYRQRTKRTERQQP